MRPGLTKIADLSRLDNLTAPDAFLWCTGIEDTFVFNPHEVTGRILDEYELTGHYQRWSQDIDLIAELGVTCARYGIPWYKIQPEKDRWDWEFADKTIGKLLEMKIDPIVDLIHYGTPAWMERSFLEPDFPTYMAEYGARFAERFKGRVKWYTPMNEPRITAWYCGYLGWWPPNERGWKGFVALSIATARGIVETDRAMAGIDPELMSVHVDAGDLYDAADTQSEEVTRFRQELCFLSLDLVTGKVRPGHTMYNWLLKHGARESDLDWLAENAVDPHVVGYNIYPMFTYKHVVNVPGRRFRKRYADRQLVERLGRMYYERYRCPIMVTETASMGSIDKRARWLAESVEGVKNLRKEGIPLIGYTWWPMFDLVTWAYRQVTRADVEKYIVPMGLWDLAKGPDGRLMTTRTKLVDQYRELVMQGHAPVGELAGGEN